MVSMLLSNRLAAVLLVAAAAVVMVTGRVMTNPWYRCPVRLLSERPCPGCGLSRAGWMLVAGRFDIMWRLHPFAPYFALWSLMLLGAAILPKRWRERWAAGWVALEASTKMHAILLIAFVLFGVARLLGSIVQPH